MTVSEDRCEPLSKRGSDAGLDGAARMLPNPFLPTPSSGYSAASSSPLSATASALALAAGPTGTATVVASASSASSASSTGSGASVALGAPTPTVALVPLSPTLVGRWGALAAGTALSPAGGTLLLPPPVPAAGYAHRPSSLSAAVYLASSPDREDLGTSPTRSVEDTSPPADLGGASMET